MGLNEPNFYPTIPTLRRGPTARAGAVAGQARADQIEGRNSKFKPTQTALLIVINIDSDKVARANFTATML